MKEARTSRRILVADDDPAQLKLALHFIRALDFEVYSAADGRHALEQIREHRIQLAVLDWMMPEMTGVEVCRQLRELPWIVHSIILTAHGTKDDLTQAIDAGASDYLIKPFNPAELRARLQVGDRILALQDRATQRQKLESIGQLAAGVAHEINTPSQFVSDNLRFLNDYAPPLLDLAGTLAEWVERVARGEPIGPEALAKAQQLLATVDLECARQEIPLAIAQSIEGVDRVASIVRAMKQFSHSGGSQRAATNLNESLQSTATVSRGEWKHVADVEFDLDPELPEVECRPGEISQVFLNLIVNAAHAIGDARRSDLEKGIIGISTRAEGDRVRIAISDSGTGIPPEVRERIFEPFFTTKEVGKGTGQGLSLAYDVIVRAHGGTIDFESEVGRGTTFVIRLPIAPGDTAEPGE